MTNKYLEKIASLESIKDTLFKDKPSDLYEAKIKLAKKLRDRLGEGIHRQYKRITK